MQPHSAARARVSELDRSDSHFLLAVMAEAAAIRSKLPVFTFDGLAAAHASRAGHAAIDKAGDLALVLLDVHHHGASGDKAYKLAVQLAVLAMRIATESGLGVEAA